MNVKTVFRTLVFLVILFVVLYVGMNNSESISFFFPLLSPRPVLHTSAGIIFFFVFAAGVFAGTLLHGGGSGGGGKSKK